MDGVQFRVLQPGETERLLDLLDGWPFPDGQSGRSFFRRYVELDPTFRPDNVWVAEAAGELVSCVQIFPRRVRIRGVVVPMGGIGSVFTRHSHRRRGLAGALLERAIGAMRERGMVLSFLYADRLEWYGRYGYRPWSRGRRTLHLPTRGGGLQRTRSLQGEPGMHPAREARGTCGAGDAPDRSDSAEVRRYSAERDRRSLESLWRQYADGAGGAALDGIVHRGADDWRGSFRLAGTPDEDIWIAERAGRVRACLRAADFDGHLRVLEWGRDPDGAGPLCDLLAAAMAGRGVRSIRLPMVRDRDVERRLLAAGARIEALPAWDETAPGQRPPPTWMVRSLDDDALAGRLGLAPGGDLLARCLPPERFAFWDADRF